MFIYPWQYHDIIMTLSKNYHQFTAKIILYIIYNIYRFQDDLFAVNDNGNFQRILQDIYPKEMIVSNTNISNSKCSYLDLLISV